MNFFDLYLKKPVFAPADDAGAGAVAGDAAAAGAADAGAGDAGAAGAADAGAAGAGDAGAAPAVEKWWEKDKFTDDQRRSLTASGYTTEDPLDAIAKLTDAEIAAQRKLGAKPDQLIGKPKEGQSLSEWKAENRDLFGVPEKAEDYKIEIPEGFGEGGLKWDTDFEGRVRELAHERGLSNEDVQGLTEIYADKIKAMEGDATQQLERANTQMMTDLTKDWGDQTNAKIQQAKSAAEMLAAKIGMDSEALAGLSDVLSTKAGGDANTLKLFAAIGEMMGEDSMGQIRTLGGSLTTTPEQARAELAQQQSPDGEWFKATQARNKAEIDRLKPRMDQLRKIAG
ncbi:hypothetical protein [Pacificibacter marinus]|uniref:hypothetical protein n=1 Tax=Pacificibacter marinus TaxID=658057 RepID=UPI001C07305F|nr:hypothetical protein [Pacificibacter marinus]MBU2867018.1 hypothetical protein [Pacificibacter marinus]